jgi:beta-glucosidase
MLSKLLSLVFILPFQVLGAPALNFVSLTSSGTPTVFSAPVTPSATVANSTSTTSSASASTSGASTNTHSHYSFTPYPTPTLNPLPPVFPATDPLNPPDVSCDPQIVPDFAPAWATAYEKAKNLVCEFSRITSIFNFRHPLNVLTQISDYTIEEKVNITTGVGWANGLCVGNIPPNKNFPGLCLEVRMLNLSIHGVVLIIS